MQSHRIYHFDFDQQVFDVFGLPIFLQKKIVVLQTTVKSVLSVHCYRKVMMLTKKCAINTRYPVILGL